MHVFQAAALAVVGCLVPVTAGAFNATEHKEIGDAAFDTALSTLPASQVGRLMSQSHLHKRHRTIGAVAGGREFARFTFGDLVAIYGDHVLTVEEMNSRRFRRHARSLDHRAAILKRINRGMSVASFPAEHRHMVELALNNADHFSRRAVKAYVRLHRRALRLARQPGKLWRALHVEALALHSFSDLYAVGHMFDNRVLSDKLVTGARKIEQKIKPLGKIAGAIAQAGAAAMGARVNFLHNALNWRGARLINLNGQQWSGYGDGRYRIRSRNCRSRDARQCSDPITKRQRQIIVASVATSIREILRTALGMPVRRPMAATCALPVRYANAHWPIEANKQPDRIAMLAARMQQQGRPLHKNGFDFSLGVLLYERRQRAGSVEYLDLVQQHCNQRG